MSEMKKQMQESYLDEANKHADFLCAKVFKPAFVMAFVHGVKHGREDLEKELNKEIENDKNEGESFTMLEIDP